MPPIAIELNLNCSLSFMTSTISPIWVTLTSLASGNTTCSSQFNTVNICPHTCKSNILDLLLVTDPNLISNLYVKQCPIFLTVRSSSNNLFYPIL